MSAADRLTNTSTEAALRGVPPKGTTAVQNNKKGAGALSFFRNMKTAKKLLAGFLTVSALMVIVGTVGITKLSASQQNLDGMYADNLRVRRVAGPGRQSTSRSPGFRLPTSPCAKDEQARAPRKRSIQELDEVIDENWQKYAASAPSGQEATFARRTSRPRSRSTARFATRACFR